MTTRSDWQRYSPDCPHLDITISSLYPISSTPTKHIVVNRFDCIMLSGAKLGDPMYSNNAHCHTASWLCDHFPFPWYLIAWLNITRVRLLWLENRDVVIEQRVWPAKRSNTRLITTTGTSSMKSSALVLVLVLCRLFIVYTVPGIYFR